MPSLYHFLEKSKNMNIHLLMIALTQKSPSHCKETNKNYIFSLIFLCRLNITVYLSCVPDISTATLHGCNVDAQPFLCSVTVNLLWNVT